MQLTSRHIFIGVIFILQMTISGCQPALQQSTPIPPPATVECSECGLSPVGTERTPIFQEKITGCAAESTQETRSEGPGTEEGPALTLEGSTLRYTHAVNHNCCSNLATTAEEKDSRIVFTESWQGKVCRCVCFSEIDDSLSDLKPGSYQVEVIQKGDPDALEPDKEITLLSAAIEVK